MTQRRTWKTYILFEKTATLYMWRKQSLYIIRLIFKKEVVFFCLGFNQPFCGLKSIVARVKMCSIKLGGLIKTGNPHLCVMNKHAMLNFSEISLFQGQLEHVCRSTVHPHTANIKTCIYDYLHLCV